MFVESLSSVQRLAYMRSHQNELSNGLWPVTLLPLSTQQLEILVHAICGKVVEQTARDLALAARSDRIVLCRPWERHGGGGAKQGGDDFSS